MSIEAKNKTEKKIENFFQTEPEHSKKILDESLSKMVQLRDKLDNDSITVPEAWVLAKEIYPLILELEKTTTDFNFIIGVKMSEFKTRARNKAIAAYKN